ncbi:MAG: aminotransferase class I/II-fold pyridoxal phosphate-dependent enzyme [Christensenellaceae bacterium]|jgi:LL-diaminopimelate aminotransferase|nr:aminotransferase class I/II-fold pyridoxal phosphate-dependent enzyme [Christensenellaceae bacterium]
MLNIRLNKNFNKLKTNYVFAEVAKYKNKGYIDLSIGDWSLPLVPKIKDAIKKALDDDEAHKYPPETGYDFLKEAIQKYYRTEFNVDLDKTEIFINDGANSDLANIFDILGKNNFVTIVPTYPVPYESVLIKNKLNKKSSQYVLYLCSPNNPTGKVLNIENWVNLANKIGALIIFDGAYSAYNTNGTKSIFQIKNSSENCIEINSLSKMAGFTGLRCGWTIIKNESLKKMWTRRVTTCFNGVPYIIQKGAETALSPEVIEENKKNIQSYMKNAAKIKEFLKMKKIKFVGGENSPYIFCDYKFTDFIKKYNILGVPFGSKTRLSSLSLLSPVEA